LESKLLRKVTKEFNKYRYPEAKAKILVNRDDILVVEFTGTKASFACCFDENFIDYQYYLKDIAGKDFKIVNILRKTEDKFWVFYKDERER
jgi:hypothetical protein